MNKLDLVKRIFKTQVKRYIPELKQAELIDIVSIDAELEIKKFFLNNRDVLNKSYEG